MVLVCGGDLCRATGELANHRREFARVASSPSWKSVRTSAHACGPSMMPSPTVDLTDGRWLHAADVMMGYAFISFERNVGVETPPFNAEQYSQRLKARPGYLRAFEANLCRQLKNKGESVDEASRKVVLSIV